MLSRKMKNSTMIMRFTMLGKLLNNAERVSLNPSFLAIIRNGLNTLNTLKDLKKFRSTSTNIILKTAELTIVKSIKFHKRSFLKKLSLPLKITPFATILKSNSTTKNPVITSSMILRI